jgi:hypothetical protein
MIIQALIEALSEFVSSVELSKSVVWTSASLLTKAPGSSQQIILVLKALKVVT